MSEEDGSIRDIAREMMNNNTDCVSCRAISSCGLCIAGLYLFQQRNNFGKVNSYVQTAIAAGLVAVAFARGMAMPPFTKSAVWRGYQDFEKKYGDEGAPPPPPAST